MGLGCAAWHRVERLDDLRRLGEADIRLNHGGSRIPFPGALSVAAGLVFYAVEVASGVAARDVRLDAWNHGYAAGFIGLFLLLGVGLLVGEFDVIPAALWDPMRIVYGYLWIVLATGLPLW